MVGWGTLSPSLAAWTYVWYSVNGTQRVILDADVTLSVTNIVSLADLDRLMTHEWGHALGLDHSNTESAVMAGPPATHYNAFVTPQADDLRGCRCQYGLPSGRQRRVRVLGAAEGGLRQRGGRLGVGEPVRDVHQ